MIPYIIALVRLDEPKPDEAAQEQYTLAKHNKLQATPTKVLLWNKSKDSRDKTKANSER